MASPAPELVGLTNWINSTPFKLADMRGKVILLQFWTFGCINCKNTLPFMKQLHKKNEGKALVIIGVHSPEFPHEADAKNLRDAVKRHGLNYPIAADNSMQTWRAYSNRYWPAFYLIDKRGRVNYIQTGEGNYDVLEKRIEDLLQT